MPDVGTADFQMSRQHRIIAACEKWWPLLGPHGVVNSSDCSGFVTSVAAELGVPLAGDADDIYRAIHSPPWSLIGFGDHAAEFAGVAAANGQFVVGAWFNPSGHGHVAVIVDTHCSSPILPYRTRSMAYWGTFGDEGERYHMHSESWGGAKRPHVFYAAHDIDA